MKRRDLEKHLKAHGCVPESRSGCGPHDIWRNPSNGLNAAIPRKKEIKTGTGRSICDDLGVPRLNKK